MNIPNYTEGFEEVGFSSVNPQDFLEEKLSPVKQRLIAEIGAEFVRLKVGKQQQECICHAQVGTTRLEHLPDFNLMLFRDYLKRLIVGEPAPF